MKNHLIFLLIPIIFSCKTEIYEPHEIIHSLYISNKTPLANGTSLVEISVQLNPDADEDKRSVVFHVSDGKFIENQDTVITKEAEYINERLVATVKFLVPIYETKIYLSAKPASSSRYNSFLLKGSIKNIKVIPTAIQLTPSAFSVPTAFGGEVSLIGILKNNGNVTQGAKVIFEDFSATGKPINGRYRATRSSTDVNSTVSTYYSPGNIPPGERIIIICTYMDSLNNKTQIKDSCEINVIINK